MATFDRFGVNTFAAAGSVDYINRSPNARARGLQLQVKRSGNGSLKVHACNLDDAGTAANYTDITSLISGGAQITASGFWWLRDFIPGALRVECDSVQAANTIITAVGF